MHSEQITLFDASGARKYLCVAELRRFLDAAQTTERMTRGFCWLLACSGCRISEALTLTPGQLDPDTGRIILRTLKRRKVVYRSVPIPASVLLELCALGEGRAKDARLWPWCRQTAWRKVRSVMQAAHIDGTQAMPKGLRHAFGVANAENNVPMGVKSRPIVTPVSRPKVTPLGMAWATVRRGTRARSVALAQRSEARGGRCGLPGRDDPFRRGF
jgi:integrase/recombinase XerD